MGPDTTASTPMTSQEVDALKAEVSSAVDAAIQPDMTRDDALKAVADAVDSLSGEKEPAEGMPMGGMGIDKNTISSTMAAQDKMAQ
jgi:hypothetical protein